MSLPTAWDVRAAAGEPHAVIRVRNLQTTLGPGAATDAWGRTGRAQPAVLSAEVVLDAPFAEAAVTDRVAADTVHYGTLSKALLENIAHWGGPSSNGKAGADDGPSVSLMTVLYGIWVNLTGQTITGWTSKPMKLDAPVPINSSVVRSFSVSVLLPKASLAGEGVSMTLTGILAPQAAAKDAEVRIDHARPAPIVSHTLRLHRIRVPTLVGVHPHERTAKQVVIADVALDQYNGYVDVYTQLEAFVVRIMEISAFETLEALATHLARKIIREFRPTGPTSELPSWYVHVALEKPIAVPFADAPVVEVRMGAQHL